MEFNKSFMNTENNIGDRLQPCATPCYTPNIADFSPSKSTVLLDASYIFLITRNVLPFTPMSHNFNHRPSRHTVSHVFCTSQKKAYVSLSSLNLPCTILFMQKPACPSCNAPPLSKHCTNRLLSILQNTLPTTLRRVIPL